MTATITKGEDVVIAGVNYNSIYNVYSSDVITFCQDIFITGVGDKTMSITCTYFDETEATEMGLSLATIKYE